MTLATLHLHVDAKFTSPYAMSVFVSLHEKGLSFDISTVDLAKLENQQAAFAASSLTQRVPLLIHDGFALSESSAITEYLDEVFPEPALYPADIRQRARARQVQAWLRSDFLPIRLERSTERVFYPSSEPPPLSAPAQASAGKLVNAAQALLANDSLNLFDRWSIADVDLTVMLQRLIMNGDPVPQRLVDYAQHQWRRPSVQLWVEHKRAPL